MDAARQALAPSLPTHVRSAYTALTEYSNVHVSRTTLWYRDKGRPSRLTKAQGQPCLTPSEEKAFIQHVLHTATPGIPCALRTSLSEPSASPADDPQRRRSSHRTRTGIRHSQSAIHNLPDEVTGRWTKIVTTTIYTQRLRPRVSTPI
jgi:hypothetical protein